MTTAYCNWLEIVTEKASVTEPGDISFVKSGLRTCIEEEMRDSEKERKRGNEREKDDAILC
ncbi:hypothetical protein BgiMline_027236, partial [Biomphalaria glabrata]